MLARNLTYNPLGGPKGMNTGAGGEVDNQSGECDCIEVVNPGSMMERVYSYDNNRNLLAVSATNTPWYNQTFGYDALNRLTSAEGRYGSFSYTYDKVGNRLTRTHNGETEDYTYQTRTNKLTGLTGSTGSDPISFTFDTNGNITGIGGKTLIYNQNNRLITVEENSTVLGEYAYNALGQRVKKDAAGNVTIFHYDANGNIIAEGLPDGAITKEYLYMGSIRMAMVDVGSQNFYYFLNDRLGTPQLMTDETGTVIWEAIYKPFGEALVHPKASVVNNFRFPGQYFDQETDLHYNYHRYYDPGTGRYLRPDPIGLEGGINLFVYAWNNPINLIDPFGLKEFEMTLWVGGSVGYIIVGGGVYDVTITDVETGESTLYTMKVLGMGVGLPSLRGSSRPIKFEVEDPCATSASFEGYGYIGSVCAEAVIGIKVGGGIKIPHGPFIPGSMIGWERGGFDIGVSHSITHWSR